MSRIRRAAIAALVPLTALAIAGCASTPDTTPTTPDADCVVTQWGYDGPIGDVAPPCRLDLKVWLDPANELQTAYFAETCTDAGGLITDTVGETWTCEGLDY